MSQYTINIGALPNDGTGDPLRTAFNETNQNFNQIFAAGPVLSNIQIANNTILTTNTNGNLVLAPNGTAVVQSNVSIVPNTANIRNLGSTSKRWATVYAQYLNISSGTTVGGDLVVSGNLTITGNTIQLGNLVTDAKTVQLANTAANASSANGSGITVGVNDDIATFLYSDFFNSWSSSVGLHTSGNILGNFVAPGGNTQILYNRNGVIGASPNDFSYNESTETLYVTVGSFIGEPNGSNGLFVGEPAYTDLGSNVMGQFTGNVPSYTQINIQNINSGNTASADYIITADNGSDITHFLDLGMASSNWDGSEPNSLGNNVSPNDGYLYVQDGNLVLGVSNGGVYAWNFDTTGNLTATGNIITTGNIIANYFVGNVSAGNIIGTVATAEYANLSGSATSVPVGNITGLANVAISGNYSDLSGQPVIPTATSNLTNDSGYITLGDIPTDLSLYTNDVGFITANVTGNVSATGNVTGGNLISNNGVYANVDLIVGDRANASASKGRFVSNSGFMYLQVGNGTAGSTGNIVFSPYQNSTARVTVDTASGNITAVGNVSAGNISAVGNIAGNTAGYAIGYRDIPQVSFTGDTTIATTDAGKHYYSTLSTGNVLTIANNESQGFQVGAAITIVNQGTGTITIAQGAGVTLYLAGNVTAGNRSVATFGMATLIKVATDTWFINGAGVS